MRRSPAVFVLLIGIIGGALAIIPRVGFPMRALVPPGGALAGAQDGLAIDGSRSDVGDTAGPHRGDFGIVDRGGAALGGRAVSRGHLPARRDGLDVEMGSFQTSALAAQGYVVVTLNQPGAVAAARLPLGWGRGLAPQTSIVPCFAADVRLVPDRLAQINADPAEVLHGLLDLDRVGVMGLSLGAIVTAQACASDLRIGACLMMDAPVPSAVASVGLRQPALWISRPPADQRLERAASGGWPEAETAAQSGTTAEALSHSPQGQQVLLERLFHVDFTDLPAIQPILGWPGQSGSVSRVLSERCGRNGAGASPDQPADVGVL